MRMQLHRIVYRLQQVRQQLGFVTPLSMEERAEVERWLPASAMTLFQTMSNADQRHSLRVCRGLLTRGCTEEDLLAAALLHDVGKAQGRVPFWTRPVIVLGKLCAPQFLARLAVYPYEEELQSSALMNFDNRRDEGEASLPAALPPLPSPYRYLALPIKSWRRVLGYAWWHAEIGAELAASAGLSERAVLYIRTHHQSDGPAAELYIVDEVS